MILGNRYDIPLKYRWNFKLLFENNQAWLRKYEEIKEIIEFHQKNRNEFALNPKEYIKEFEVIDKELEALYKYIKMKCDIHLNSKNLFKKQRKINVLRRKHKNNKRFMIKFIQDTKSGFYKENFISKIEYKYSEEKYDYLSRYRRYTNHIKGIEISLNNEKFILNKNNYNEFKKIYKSDIPKLYDSINQLYYNNSDALFKYFLKDIKKNKKVVRKLNYNSVLTYYLSKEDIPFDIIDSLEKTVDKAINIFQKTLKFNLDDFEVTKNFELDTALNIIENSYSKLGNEYLEKFNYIISYRLIDYFAHQNKKIEPYTQLGYYYDNFILINYYNSFRDMKTLTHEIGHLIKRMSVNKNNNYYNSQYTNMISETAALVNEILLYEYLINSTVDMCEKSTYIYFFLKRFENSFFKQVQVYELQKYMYELKDEDITIDNITNKYQELLNKYNSSTKSLKSAKYSWLRKSHLLKGFHTYKYAIGILLAIEIANKILNEDNFSVKYNKFLKAGNMKIEDMLSIIDIDITNIEEIFNRSIRYYEKYVNRFYVISKTQSSKKD